MNKSWHELVKSRFSLGIKTKKPLREFHSVATFGSCFANEIRFSLMERGIRTLPRLTRSFSSFTAPQCFEIPSWGCYDERVHLQLYNPGSIAQELLRSVGQFSEADSEVWTARRSDGSELYADPYKRFLFAESLPNLLRARKELNDLIIDALCTADTIVLTLGLTEAFKTQWGNWACLPPTILDRNALRNSGFSPMGYPEAYETLSNALRNFVKVYPDKQIVITTSPIPLDRTFRDIDIAIASTESKAILRTLCSELEREIESVVYFPSFEMVVFDRDAWEPDYRHVNRKTVARIVSAFSSCVPKLGNSKVGLNMGSWEEYTQSWSEVEGMLNDLFWRNSSSRPVGLEEGGSQFLEDFLKDYDRKIIGSSPGGEPASVDFWQGGKPYRITGDYHTVHLENLKVFRNSKIETLTRLIGNADFVIELGSGPGWNLVSIAAAMGEASRSVGMHAFEYTEAGRRATNQLSATMRVSIRTHPFDFHDPKGFLGQLGEISLHGRVVVFTSYAIEQIPQIAPEIFEAILGIPGLSKVIHIEPVGWQIQEELLLPAPSNLGGDYQSISVPDDHRDYPIGFDVMAEESSKRNGYNENLFSMLRQFEKEDRLRIISWSKNHLSHRFDLPGTVIEWVPIM